MADPVHPYLTGEQVYLRALERDDLRGPMLQWANDPELTNYMYMGTVPNVIEALERDYDLLRSTGSSSLLQLPHAPSTVVFAVIEREHGRHIGNVGLFGIDWISRSSEFRAIIGDKEYWGGGYAFETYRLIIGYAFDRLNLRRLSAGTRADNVQSIVALRKVGFVEEGRLREHFLRDERAYDTLLYGLLRHEFYELIAKAT